MPENKSGNQEMNRSGSDKFCQGCGANLSKEALFCEKCGRLCNPSPPAPSPPGKAEHQEPRWGFPDIFGLIKDMFSTPTTQDKPQKSWWQSSWLTAFAVIAIIFAFFTGIMNVVFDVDVFKELSCSSGGSSTTNSSGSTTPASGYGQLLIASDGYGLIHINGQYYFKGSGTVSLPPGYYVVSCYSASTGKLVWQTQTRVYSGKTSQIRNNTWAR